MTVTDAHPNVIFCNLMYSGSSGVDPVLRELLRVSNFYFTPFGPEGTNRLGEEVIGRHAPFYHWTHDAPETFVQWFGRPDFRFIFLHRDPRDVVVSWAHDFQHQNTCPGMSLRELMHMVITHNLPPNLNAACRWLQVPCLAVKFDDFKRSPQRFFEQIIDYLGFDPFSSRPLEDLCLSPASQEKLANIIRGHSFEKIAGRQRGQMGEMIRTGYMLRKGISGEWRAHFDEELSAIAKQYLGTQIIELGYEQGDDW